MAKAGSEQGPPRIGDFSKEATDRAVRSATLQHPLTVFPASVGVLGVLAAVLLGPGGIALGAAIGGLGLGAGSWIVNHFFRREAHANRYIKKLQKALEEHKAKLHESVRNDLIASTDIKGAEHLAVQGTDQFTKIEEKFDNLRKILSGKLGAGELTFGRYYGTAEQVYLSVLDNLQDIITILKSVRAIDIEYIEGRLASLDQLTELTEADRQELSTLDKRKQLRDEQLQKVNMLLTRNEEAMTDLDQTAAALSEMKTVQGRASLDMESARKELEELAKRAQDYSL